MADPPLILQLVTEPDRRPVLYLDARISGFYPLIGYRSYDLKTGELIADAPLTNEDDYAYLFGMLHVSVLAQVDKPLFLLLSDGDLDVFWHWFQRLFDREVSLRPYKALTTSLPLWAPVPAPGGKDWLDFPANTVAQEVYFPRLCEVLGLPVEPDASMASMLRRIVGHLAEQEAIVL
jgi:hypothetical protein